jgi:hypothetical protein
MRADNAQIKIITNNDEKTTTTAATISNQNAEVMTGKRGSV